MADEIDLEEGVEPFRHILDTQVKSSRCHKDHMSLVDLRGKLGPVPVFSRFGEIIIHHH